MIARAARRVIVTVERLVETDEVKASARDTVLYPFEVDAVVLAEHGASPTACPPFYAPDSHELVASLQHGLRREPFVERSQSERH